MSRQQNREHRNPQMQLQSVNQWHHRIIELMLHDATLNQQARATALGVTQAWLSQVESSDMFQDELARAREAHRELLSYTTIERTRAAADLALDTISEKITRERTNLGLTELSNTATDMMKMLGYGEPKNGSGGAHQVNVAVAVDAGLLERARARMRAVGLTAATDSQAPLESPNTSGGPDG